MLVNYIFGDLKTGQVIQEIPMFGVTISDWLNIHGEFGGSYQLDMTGKTNDELVSASIPGRCYLVVELDTIPIWGGIIYSRTYQATSKTFQLYAKSFEAYPNERIIRTNLSYQDIDQITIFLDLWVQMQEVQHGSLLVEIPPFVASGVLKTVEVTTDDYRTYGQVMSALADGAQGFDWQIRLVRSGNAYRRILTYGFPQLGAPANENSIVLEYPGAILNYWATEAVAISGTHIDLIGAGEGTNMLTSQFVHTDLLNTGFIEFDIEIPYKDVTSQNVLDDLTLREGINRRIPATVIKAEVKIDLDPVFYSYQLGDHIRIVINDPRFEKFDFVKRLIGWDFRPPTADSIGRAFLTFEGDEE